MEVKTKVVSFEETFTQSSSAAPDGNQMEESDRKGGSLRIYPFSSGETPSSDTPIWEGWCKTPAAPTLSRLFWGWPSTKIWFWGSYERY